jgi:hypothetical protein
MTKTRRKAIQELSADTSLLVERLRKVGVGETIAYDDLTKAVDRDVRGIANGNLRSAIHIVQRDYQIVFGTLRGVGLKRLDDVGTVALADNSIRKIHREAKRGRDKLLCVSDVAKLSNEERIKYNAGLAAFGALHEVTKTKSQERLEAAVKTVGDKLPVATTLQAFVGG